jgi:hypothetical protein
MEAALAPIWLLCFMVVVSEIVVVLAGPLVVIIVIVRHVIPLACRWGLLRPGIGY